MTAHRLLAFTTATAALALSTPALAQASAPEATIEYASPLSIGEIVFESDPVVQPIPGAPTVATAPQPVAVAPPAPPPPAIPALPEQVSVYGTGPVAGAHLPPPAPIPPALPAYENQAYARPDQAGYYPAPPQPRFDREAWLSDCHERIRGVGRRDRARVIGGLLGAVAGGVIGNRAWGSERLAGTLLGAGAGGLAGVAIGDAIGGANDRKHDDECAWYLDQAMSGGYGAPGYGVPGYPWGSYPASGYGYGYGYPAVTYVPVLVATPQRAVVHEYVTEEWVDEPVRSRSIPRATEIRHSAPRGDKRTKLIRTK